MKKLLIGFLIFTSFIFSDVVYAGSYTVSTSASYVLVGNKVNIIVNVSGLAGKFKVTSSDTSVLSGGSSGIWLENESKTFTFTAKKAGTVTVTVTPLDAADLSDNSPYSTVKSLKINVTNPSNNNYLAEIKVDNYTLNPVFNKDVLEYSVEVPNDVRKVNISATKDNSMAAIKGAGEVSLNEGVNPFDIVVTAQNGSVRTYKLNVIVKELDPIEVNVDGNTYRVVRKEELLPSVNPYFELSTTKIGEDEVPCYINNNTNMILVGLQSTDTIRLYIYDGNYKLYDELNTDKVYIQILDMDPTLLDKDYQISKINIGDKSYTAYVKDGYPIVYGMNVKNGEKALYKYDEHENTLQRFEKIEVKTHEQLYFIIALCSIGFTIISYILFITLLMKKNKHNKKRLQNEK